MDVRYYIDPETGEAHLLRHRVTEVEAAEVLERPIEDRPGKDGARMAVGRTDGGRYVRVIYVPDETPNSVFVITAYPLGAKALRALRRRRKSK